MYHFDGEFRRMPKQSLGGASKVEERDQLLRRAHLERIKREEERKKFNSTKLIQALVRSFLVRNRNKSVHRAEFDQILCGLTRNSVGESVDFQTISVLSAKLLFFYNSICDSARLLSILQILLRKQKEVLSAALVRSDPWVWRLRRLLYLSLRLITQAGSRELIALPLRIVEVYTSQENVQKALPKNAAVSYLSGTFTYLISKGYLQMVRELIDSKTPPLMDSSPVAPTPLVGCLLDMVTRPLRLIHVSTNPEFKTVTLKGLCESFLCPTLTEPVKLFVLPAFANMADFPFSQFIDAVCYDLKGKVPCNTVLLYSVLTLDSKLRYMSEEESRGLAVSYLQVLAPLTSNLSRILPLVEKCDENASDDSDDESLDEKKIVSRDELEVASECVELLNEVHRVKTLLKTIDASAGDPIVLRGLCQMCHHLLVSDKAAAHKYRILNMLALKPAFLRDVWAATLAAAQTSLFGEATPLLNVIARGCPTTPEDSAKVVPLLAVFCSLFTLLIITLHDAEFYPDLNVPGSGSQAMPFSLEDLVHISAKLKEVSLGLVDLAFPESRPAVRDNYRSAIDQSKHSASPQDTQMWAHLFKVVVGLVQQLHARDLRRPFCPEGHWISKQVTIPVERPSDFVLRRDRLHRPCRPFREFRVFTREELAEGPPLTTKEVRILTFLRELPFVVPFEERVRVFQSLVNKDKMDHQSEAQFLQGPSIFLSVRRTHLYEDAFDRLSLENESDLRLKMRVQLVNMVGMDEAGVDGGGLFREFLSELLKTAFDPNRGFFRITNDNLLYPNPNVHLIVPDFLGHYYFIGRMLGKALYENLLVELPLADFFLSKLVGRRSDVGVHHLASLDPVMYRNLLYLKNFEDDVSDLGLDFTVVNEELGETTVAELKPNGANIPVTSSNRIEYIHLVADYRLNKQIRAQCNAFRQGLSNVIPLEWIQMFNNKELQVLISGAEIPVNVEDLKQHTSYSGIYDENHPTIRFFWKVVEGFSDMQLRQLLKFVTSCSRPPLLGFKELDPPFCIQPAGNAERLPTASTCMNLLKLPEFSSEAILRDKLLYALQSNAGFELT